MERVYLDANASYGQLAGLEKEVFARYNGACNPSSIHQGGQKARALIEEAREQVALLLGLGNGARSYSEKGYRVVFTSGATEANNTFLLSSRRESARRKKAFEVITTSVEHPSILEPLVLLQNDGAALRFLTPRAACGAKEHLLDASDVTAALTENTDVVSLMWANNETGHIYPVEHIAAAVKQHSKNTLVHVDAAQALGKVELQIADSCIDALSISGHKIGAFPGVGALVLRDDTAFVPLLLGGPQETRYRAGTENVPGIISFGLAALHWLTRGVEIRRVMRVNKIFVEEFITTHIPGARFYSEAGEGGLANTISVRIPGVRSDDLVVALDLQGVAISSGSACASGKQDPSHVIMALGAEEIAARETIRMSLRGDESKESLAGACDRLVQCVRQISGAAV